MDVCPWTAWVSGWTVGDWTHEVWSDMTSVGNLLLQVFTTKGHGRHQVWTQHSPRKPQRYSTHTQRFDACVIRNSIPLLKQQQYFDNNGMCWLKIVSGVTWVHVLACRQELSLIPIHWMSHRTFFPRRFDSRCLRHQSVWFNLLHDIERRPRHRWCLISNISATFRNISINRYPNISIFTLK